MLSAPHLQTEKSGDAIYSCLKITGDDRVAFLQGQLTQDVARLDDDGTLPAAWCTPKGRVLVTGRLLALDDGAGFIIPSVSSDSILKRLQMYRLRASVDISVDESMLSLAMNLEDCPDTWRLPDETPGSVAMTGGVAILRLTATVIEVHGPEDALAGPADGSLPATDWQRARIEAGLVDIDAGNAERFTPHMLNLDKTGAVSFTKGCYTGQEVVARTENLGRVKRRVNRYRLASGTAAAGDKLSAADGAAVGQVVNAAGDELLAVVPVERHGEALELDGVAASPLPLPYSTD